MAEELTRIAAAAPVVLWLGLMLLRGGFWKADQRLGAASGTPDAWPAVVAVVPARNEAPYIGRAVASLVGQDYPGGLRAVVVDDNSEDGTAAAARAAVGTGRGLEIISGQPLADGWTGKLWAAHQGLGHVEQNHPGAKYALLTDADVVHDPSSVRRLVAKAEGGDLGLVSLMVLLPCGRFWERLLIPAYVFFFQKLYPFRFVNRQDRPEAAAAGGCMLVRRDMLARAGGVNAIRDRVIDDCALAGILKPQGGIWLGLSRDVRGIRGYDGLGEIWRMVARTAFAQLGHSALALAGTVAGMGVLYAAAPVLAAGGLVSGDGYVAGAGLAGWALIGAAYWPTVRLYGLHPVWVVFLPFAALLYTLMTVDSARRHWQGRGGSWKGRSYGKPRQSGI